MRERRSIVGSSRVKMLSKFCDLDMCEVTTMTGKLMVGFSADEDGWEHVSVSPMGSKREADQACPTWRQMCDIKSLFWRDDEMVVQLHPPEDRYFHGPGFDTNILHLWRPVGGDWGMLSEKEKVDGD